MNRIRRLLAAGAILQSTWMATGSWGSASWAADRPNIVFLLADDLGWKDVGYHGGEIQTPNLDRLATMGTRLEQFYVQPVCSPTRCCLMTGRYPMRCGLQVGVVRPWANHGLPLEERTLANALGEAGYVTAITGKWHLGHLAADYLPTRRGFVHQYGHYNGALDYFTHLREGSLDWHRDDQPLEEEGYTTDLLGKEAVRLIREHDRSRPLFLYVPFNAAHTPLQAPDRYLALYSGIGAKKRQVFAAMVTCLDDAVGRIVAALDERGMREDTLILFSSDNGGPLDSGADNGALRDGKGSLYEGGVRVPAFVNWPGVVTAGVVDKPLHMVDMYPTLIRLAGGSIEQSLPIDGKDAWPTITQGAPSPHSEILLNVTPFGGAIRIGDWKLVHNGKTNANETSGTGPDRYELFDLAADPFEKTDLSATDPEQLERLRRRLQDYADQAAEPNITPNKIPRDFVAPKIWGHPES